MSKILSAQLPQKLEFQGDFQMPLPCGHSLALCLSGWYLRVLGQENLSSLVYSPFVSRENIEFF